MRALGIVLSWLLNVASCGARFLSLPLTPPPTMIIPAAADTTLAGISNDDVILVSGFGEESQKTIVRVGGDERNPSITTVATLRGQSSSCDDAQHLTWRDNGSWWYSRCAGWKDFSIQTLTSESPNHMGSLAVTVEPMGVRGWLPIPGSEISGVALLVSGPGQLRAALIDESHQVDLGSFYRNDQAMIIPRTWQAHRIDDSLVAITSIEFPEQDGSSIVMLRTFTDGVLQETQLAFGRHRFYSLATVLAPGGRLGIVAAGNREVEAMVVDLADPGAARSTLLATDTVSAAGVRVVADDLRFITVWCNPTTQTIHLAEFNEHFTLPPVVLNNDGSPSTDTLLALQRNSAGVHVFWSNNQGIATMRFEEHPTGTMVATEWWEKTRRTLLANSLFR